MTGSCPLVVAEPCGIGATICHDVSAISSHGTLAWHDTDDLRALSDDLAALGWDALLVDADNEPLSTAAMSHLAQIHGVPSALIIGVDTVPFLPETLRVATMAARHLPELPVIFTGRLADQACAEWIPMAEGLDLQPRAIPLAGLVEALAAPGQSGSAAHGGHEQSHHTTERIA